MDNLRLLYVHGFGETWDGIFVYQFLFADDILDSNGDTIDGDDWDALPANGLPSPPNESYITLVAELRSRYIFDLLQNSPNNCMWDGIDGAIPLAIENIDDYETYPDKRMFFRYGDTFKNVKEILYNNDLILTIIENE